MEYVNGVAVGTPTFTTDGTLSGAPIVITMTKPDTGVTYNLKVYPTKA